MSYPIPAQAFDDRLAILGTAGSGKTYAALGAAARLLASGARVVMADALGVMWGLRLMADGKTPSPLRVVIFGGPHGDIAINDRAGALIGETVATMRESCILDLSELGSKAAERRFMLGFLSALYQHTTRDPLHLILDEADMWAPQRLMDKEGEAAKLLGMVDTIVRRGRVRGFVPWLITQRPAVLSKDVLSQADGLVALKLTSKQDRDAIGGWIEGQADREQGKAILAALPSKALGQAVLWIPGRDILRNVTFPKNETFDSSRTPKRGEKRLAAELKPLDLGALRDRLATVEAEAKENDPKALKAEIAKLRGQIAGASSKRAGQAAAPRDETAALRDREAAFSAGQREGWSGGYSAGWLDGEKSGFSRSVAAHHAEINSALKTAAAVAYVPGSPPKSPPLPKTDTNYAPDYAHVAQRTERRPSKPVAAGSSPAGRASNSSAILPPGERAVLIACAQFGEVEREQLTILTGYKRSSRDAYIQRLREKGLAETEGRTVRATAAGLGALPPDYEPLPTGAALQSYWLGRLPEGERRVLEVLIRAYPSAVPRDAIDEATGYKRSSRDAYLQRMRAKRLWEQDGGMVRASRELF